MSEAATRSADCTPGGSVGLSQPLPDPVVHFGGPDLPPRSLRNLLRDRVEAVPPGGEIVWATYYFRDRDLAHALMKACDRGVRVRLVLEGQPRRADANDQVLAMLGTHGLAGGLSVHRSRFKTAHPHLHSKIYYFSHPRPTVFVGSFNPSGDEPEDEEVIAEIGDQDRGHNLLVEFADPDLATGLRDHVGNLLRPWSRIRNLRPIPGRQGTAWRFPRLFPSVAERSLRDAGRIWGCISHLKKGLLSKRLSISAESGVDVRLLVHDTKRRVPPSVVRQLDAAGVSVRRYRHPAGLPMHAKYLLVDNAAWFGSLNFNPRSRWLNREILLRSEHPAILRSLRDHFNSLYAIAE